MSVGGGGGKEQTPREKMQDIREDPAYELTTGDWASQLAGTMIDMLESHLAGSLRIPNALAGAPAGLEDPLERYVRESCDASPAMSRNLMLPAAYASFGALSGTGWWVKWMGRQTMQMCPLTMQTIGLASSGSGKSTTHRALARWSTPALKTGERAVMQEVSDWADRARVAATGTLLAEKAKLSGSEDDALAWKRAGSLAAKEIDSIDMAVSRGLMTVFSDATAEALVSTAIEYGGSPFVRSSEQDILDNLVRYSTRGASLTWVTDGWDGAEYRRARRGSGIETASALVVSMSLLTQTETFFKSVGEEGGEAWLDKGLLGRVLVGMAPATTLEEDVMADEALRNGTVKEVPVDYLVSGAGWFSELGAQARASRLIEDRLRRVAGDSVFLKRAMEATAAPGVLPVAVTLGSGGSGSGEVGHVLRLSEADARRVEDLHTWMTRVLAHVLQGADRVLQPVLSRLSYHLVRLAAIREAAVRACDGTLEDWALPLSQGGEGGVLSSEVLADTATRVLPWILEMHLAVLGGVVRTAVLESLRTELVQAGGRDVSLAGQIAAVLKSSGAAFPMPAGEAAKLVARGSDLNYFKTLEFFKAEFERQVTDGGKPTYFAMAKGKKDGDAIVMAVAFDESVGVMMVG